MAMTRTQWNRLNNSLPPEDRMSYEDYLASSGETTPVEEKTKATDVSAITAPFLSEEDAAALAKSLEGLDILGGFKPFWETGNDGDTGNGGDTGNDEDTGNGGDTGDKGDTGNGGDTENGGDNYSESQDDSGSYDNNDSNVFTSSQTQSSTFTSQPNTNVSSTPDTPAQSSTPDPVVPIKTAPIDTILFDNDSVDTNIITDLLFENIGGQEILSIARYDTVNGQDVSYQPIKNLNILQEEYNPNNLLKLQKTSPYIFANYPIDLNAKIPNEGSGPNGQNIYIDADGNLVIEFINLETDEQVDVQITTSGTIYEVGI